MKQLTNLKLWDVVFTSYLSLLITPVFLISWVAFSILFAYQTGFINFTVINIFSVSIGVIGIVFYFLSIQIFMFIFNFIISIVNPKMKKGILGEHQFEITDEGFREKTNYNDSLVKWSSVDRVARVFGYTMVRVAGSQWHIFPKRSFNNNDEQLNFENTLQNKISA